MPFTPFHLGAAMVVKPFANSSFSLLIFGFTQIMMDIEPLLGLIYGWDILHGPSHTLLGALGIGLCVAAIPATPYLYALRYIDSELKFAEMDWMIVSKRNFSYRVRLISALYGSLSHVLLDGLMHHDLYPFAPFSQAQPWLGLVAEAEVYRGCAYFGLLGIIIWVIVKWRQRPDL